MNIENLIDLKGKNVVITGVASGMAKAAAQMLLSLGANVYAIDRNAIDLLVAKAIQGDLSNGPAIDKVVDQLPEKIDAAYLCCGVALMKDREQMIMDINFFGQKYLAESILPRIVDEGSVTFNSSTGGYYWHQHMDIIQEILEIDSFDAFDPSQSCINDFLRNLIPNDNRFLGMLSVKVHSYFPFFWAS